ncbi:MAG: Fic family protein [Lactobacillales bacterium]|nr:Fic family protein [Lactobacillales bacterium]
MIVNEDFSDSSYRLKENCDADKASKYKNFETAAGLQAVDGLKPSKLFYRLADEVVEGKKTYKQMELELDFGHEEKEADLVATRIAELLEIEYFDVLDPSVLTDIHAHLFPGVLDEKIVGKYRNKDIVKDEPILNGASVDYGLWDNIEKTLEISFRQQARKDLAVFGEKEKAYELFKFINHIWRIHPFFEGNTRTIAVFAIKYLNEVGFEIDNEPFKEHSYYFRNALVRANSGVGGRTFEFLNKFVDNLLFGADNELDVQEEYM